MRLIARRANVVLVTVMMAIVPALIAADAQPDGAWRCETIAQAASTAPYLGRQSGAQAAPLVAPPHAIERLRVPPLHHANSGGARRQLTFGGVTASFTSLCCLFLVYLI